MHDALVELVPEMRGLLMELVLGFLNVGIVLDEALISWSRRLACPQLPNSNLKRNVDVTFQYKAPYTKAARFASKKVPAFHCGRIVA